ncbi:hypothetical protein [Pseudorhizobium pelagicum]|uniref:hypothetical protein n=1 Tax=Pseudorhizobium pelagicum TaxID=1509405 RepID=UPI000A93790D|nr:hypothetical protein [Pseudorhizobium pelagicum]
MQDLAIGPAVASSSPAMVEDHVARFVIGMGPGKSVAASRDSVLREVARLASKGTQDAILGR